MANQEPGMDIGFLQANVDLSASQFCAVKIGTADMNVVLSTVSTAGTPTLGILQNKPTAAQAAQVRVLGVSKAKSGAAFSRNDPLTVDGSGRLITATGTTQVIAIALEAAAGANELRSVFVAPNGQAT